MKESVTYCLELARGFLHEAQQDLTMHRWRAAVSHAQLPWELFGEEEAKETLTVAKKIIASVEQLVQEMTHD